MGNSIDPCMVQQKERSKTYLNSNQQFQNVSQLNKLNKKGFSTFNDTKFNKDKNNIKIVLDYQLAQKILIGHNFSLLFQINSQKQLLDYQITKDIEHFILKEGYFQIIMNYIVFLKAIPKLAQKLEKIFNNLKREKDLLEYKNLDFFPKLSKYQISLDKFVNEFIKYFQYNLKIFESWQKIQIFVRKNKQEYQKEPLQKVIKFVYQIIYDFINNKKPVERQSFMRKQYVNTGPKKEELNQISHLERNIIELQEQNKSLHKKIKQNQDKKTKSDIKILELQNKVKELTKINQNLNEKDKKNMLIINQLQEQNKKLQEKIEELKILHDKERQKQKAQKDALNKLLKQEINQLKNKETNNQNDKDLKKQTKQNQQFSKLKKQLQNYQRQIKILKQEISKYQKQLQNQSKNLLSIEKQLKSKNQQINVQNQTIKLISLSQKTDKDKKILETKLCEFNELQNSKNKEIIEKDRKIEEQKKLLKQKDSQINQQNLIISKKQEELTKSNNQITKLKKQIFDLKDLLKLRDDEIQKLNKQNSELKILLKEKDDQIEKCNKQISELKKLLKEKDDEIQKLNKQISELKKLLREKYDQIEKCNKQISELKKLLREKEDQIIKLQNQIKRLKQQISRLCDLLKEKEDQIIKANNQIKMFKEQISKFRDLLNDKNNKIINKNKKIQNASSSLMKVKNQIKTFKLQTSKMKDYLLTKNKQENKFEENIIILEQKIRKMGPSGRSFIQYFSGQVLNINEKQCLQWFVQTLQQKTSKQIRRTKFLYRMDLKNNESFHSYYDEHPYVVFLVKLKNGNLVGAYSAAPFCQKSQQSYTESYLFSITNKKAFSPKSKDKVGPHQRSITWDQYFIIFGNSEFRIRSRQAKFYSNFSVNNSFFDNKGQKLQILIGKGISYRETEIETYEIFQIQWNN